MTDLQRKRVHRSWAFYDWANSAFSLVVTAAIFPFYYSSQVEDEFTLLGIQFTDDSILSYSISLAYLALILVIPIMSGIADLKGRRMRYLKLYTYLGAAACISLFFFKGHSLLGLAFVAYAFANIGFGGALVFYNSFLPRIADPEEMDALSSRGYILGYVGSVLLLIFCLVMIQFSERLGWEDATLAPRISFLLVGIWWIVFAQRTFRAMPAEQGDSQATNVISQGWKELLGVLQKLKGMVNTSRFLVSFLCYNAGVQTVLYLAGTFAEKELEFESSELILLILALQVFGALGAFLFARISRKVGNKLTLMILVGLWMVICFLAYLTAVKWKFYILASFVGLTMGGIQALSRATYAKLIDEQEGEFASFFSLYNVMYYFSVMLGTFSFGLLSQAFGSMRYSLLGLTVFFIAGFVVLSSLKLPSIATEKSIAG